MYSPIVAIDVAAAKATEEPSDGSERMKESVAASQTARTGERNRLSTLWKNGCCGLWSARGKARGWASGDTHDAPVARKRKHHAAVAGHAKESAVPDADYHPRQLAPVGYCGSAYS